MTKDLRIQRAKLIEDMQALNIKVESEKRDLNTEEKVSYDKMAADCAELQSRYERIEQVERMHKELGQSRGSVVDPIQNHLAGEGSGINKDSSLASPEYKRAYDKYLRTGRSKQFRDLNVGTAADGGYLVPTATSDQITQALLTQSVMRRAGCSYIQTSMNTIFPISTTVSSAWGSEATALNSGSTTDPTLSDYAAKAYRLEMNTKVSNELLADSVLDINSYIGGLFAARAVYDADNAYMTGSGSGQPSGLVQAATAFTTASTTTFTDKELVNMFYSVPAQYRSHPSMAFAANSLVIAFIAGLFAPAKATTYIPFAYSTIAGQPDTLFGKSLYASASMSSTFTATNQLLVGGAFEYYQVVDRVNTGGIKVLNELFALTNQTGYVYTMRTDGACKLADSFRTLTLHS